MAKNDLKLFAGGSSANVMTQAEYEAMLPLINGFSTGVAQSKQLNKVWRQASFVAAMIGLFTGNNSGEDVLDDSDVDGFEAKFARAMQAFIANQTATGSFWQPVISMTITTPPASPTIGDAYVIPAAATGAWAGNSQSVAVWMGSDWRIFVAKNGHGIGLPDGRLFEKVGGAYIEKLALDSQSGKWTYAAAGGTANALAVTLSPATGALVDGLIIRVRIAATNTGSATINVNGLGAVPIKRPGGAALQAGDLTAGNIVQLLFNQGVAVLTSVSSTMPGSVAVLSAVGSGSWTVPEGVNRIRVRLWGGGGGSGGAGSTTAGQGGGGGGYSEGVFAVTPGEVLSYTLGGGGGGTPGGGGSQAANGGTSSFGGRITATGGVGGQSLANGGSNTVNPVGGSGSGGQINVSGRTGGYGYPIGNQYAGGVGGGAYSSSSTPSTVSAPGAPGSFPGGGAAGGSAGNAGETGGSGLIVIEY
ncbi:DUF2793 domain-containing protein [Brucella sp. 21LCYQ03]|nr:DUF2793 domain-containing protein [Brucella sp. 21LCYQ03]